MCIPSIGSWNRRCRTSMWFPIVLMSLLGGYKKKSSYDGYESLQLVDSSGDFCTGGRSGGGLTAGTLGSVKTGPAPQDDYSTMDSSGMKPESTGWRLQASRSFIWYTSFIKQPLLCLFLRNQGGGLNISCRYPPEACVSCRLLVCCVMTIDQSHRVTLETIQYFDC